MSDEFDKNTSLENFFDFQHINQNGCNSVYIYIYAFSDISVQDAEIINDNLINDILENISLASVNLKIFNDDEFYKIDRMYIQNNKFISDPIRINTIIDYKYEVFYKEVY